MSSKKDKKHECDKQEHKHKFKQKTKPKPKHDNCKKKDHKCEKKCDCKEKECKECKCECKDKECKPKVEFFKECISVEFTVPHGKEQTVFKSNGFENISASGFVSYDCGDARYITVRFYNGASEIGNSVQVFQDSSVAFSLNGFNRISVTCPSNVPGTIPDFGSDCPGVCEGQINLSLRFQVE